MCFRKFLINFGIALSIASFTAIVTQPSLSHVTKETILARPLCENTITMKERKKICVLTNKQLN